LRAKAAALVVLVGLSHLLGRRNGWRCSGGLWSRPLLIQYWVTFLGLSTTLPLAEWGLMLNTLRAAIYLQPIIYGAAWVLHFHHELLLQHGEQWAAERNGCPQLSSRPGRGMPRSLATVRSAFGNTF